MTYIYNQLTFNFLYTLVNNALKIVFSSSSPIYKFGFYLTNFLEKSIPPTISVHNWDKF